MILLQAQAQLEQERLQCIEEKRENESERIRLDAENQVLRDNFEMMKEKLRVKDARVRVLEETLRVGEKASEKNEKEEMAKLALEDCSRRRSKLLQTRHSTSRTGLSLLGHSTASCFTTEVASAEG